MARFLPLCLPAVRGTGANRLGLHLTQHRTPAPGRDRQHHGGRYGIKIAKGDRNGGRRPELSQANPAQSPGYIAAVDALGKAIEEALGLEIKQRDGILGERAGWPAGASCGTACTRFISGILTSAGRRAQREQPEIQKLFRYKPAGGSFGAFRAAGASMVEAAQTHRTSWSGTAWTTRW